MDWDLIKRKSKWMPPRPSFIDSNEYVKASYIREWYDKEVKPLFENAIEVEAVKTEGRGSWYASEDGCMEKTHTAILVKIEPIKQETAEDLLREYVNLGLGKMAKACLYRDRENEDESLHERARRVLDQSEKK